MRKFTLLNIAALVLAGAVIAIAQEAPKMPEMPKPTPQHEWLQQLVGEWTMETEAYMEPGKPPIKSSGSETTRAIGQFWTMSEISGTCPMDGRPFTGILTIGFDPKKDKYIGTWVDSMTGQLWTYEGEVDAGGKTLTLNAEGPSPMDPTQTAKFREVIEIKDANHRTFQSSIQGEDGKWIPMMKATYERK